MSLRCQSNCNPDILSAFWRSWGAQKNIAIWTLLTPAGDKQPPHIRHPATEVSQQRAGNQASNSGIHASSTLVTSKNNLRTVCLCYQGHKINLRLNSKQQQSFVLSSLQPPRRSLAWSHPPRSRPPVQNTVRARGQSQLELQRAVSLLPSSW